MESSVSSVFFWIFSVYYFQILNLLLSDLFAQFIRWFRSFSGCFTVRHVFSQGRAAQVRSYSFTSSFAAISSLPNVEIFSNNEDIELFKLPRHGPSRTSFNLHRALFKVWAFDSCVAFASCYLFSDTLPPGLDEVSSCALVCNQLHVEIIDQTHPGLQVST